MRLSELDYELPESLIAQRPLAERDAARLLVLDRRTGAVVHRNVRDLPELLVPGDLLVVNDARVVSARLVGRKVATGGRVELLVVEPLAPSASVGTGSGTWRCLGQASKPLRAGAGLAFDGLGAEVVRPLGEGAFEVRFDAADLAAALARSGRVPLPPYIRREPDAEDADRYQTIYARAPGAVAAPTAGLHFTPALFNALESRGVARASVTLLVGPGTFLPVRTEELDAHRLQPERGEIPAATAEAILRARERRTRVVAVGTTVVRALETNAGSAGVHAGPFRTDLFIRPGHSFGTVGAMLTNFHLPRTTLLALVCAFAGPDAVLAAYQEAVRERYRFYSYGDAMLVA